jgi:hypothetical protein
MATLSKRPKVARIARTRPVTYLGRKHQYAELRDGRKVLDRISLSDRSTSLTKASSELRKSARRQGYAVLNPQRCGRSVSVLTRRRVPAKGAGRRSVEIKRDG